MAPPYTPQMNGLLERKKRTLIEMVSCIMSFSKLFISLFGYVLETTVHVLNILPRKFLQLLHHMQYEKGRIWTSPTEDYWVISLMFRNMTKISSILGLIYVDLSDNQEIELDNSFTTQ